MALKEVSWDEALEWASPFPYVLAVTVDKGGRPNIIGLAWWTFVSWDPKMVAIAVGYKRYSYECLKHLGEFALCFPSEELKEGAWFCGVKSGRKVDKFKETGFKQVPAKVITPPLIEGSTVALECKVVREVEAGDHALFIADIVAIHGDPERLRHLYSIHYRKLVSLDCRGYYRVDL